jgi:hypothetical protein
MKAGTDNKTKLYIAIGLSVVAVLTVVWSLLPSGASKPEVAPAVVSTAKEKAEPVQAALDPQIGRAHV